jgi:hypothetical protein
MTTIRIEGLIVGMGDPEPFPPDRPNVWFSQHEDGTITVHMPRLRELALSGRAKGPARSDTEFVADAMLRIIDAIDAGKLRRVCE